MIPMRVRQVSWVLVSLVSMLALVVAVAAGGAGASTQRALDQSWTDPAGDAVGGAPDLTAVQVSNDAAGTITMSVTVPMVANTVMYAFIDADMNGKVADAAGRIIAAIGMGQGVVMPLAAGYDASGNSAVTSIPSLKMTATTTAVTIQFSKTDLGIGPGFGFWLATETEAQMDGDTWGDDMPNGSSMFLYILTTPPPAPAPTPPPAPSAYKPVIGAPATTPAVAVAGKRFTVAFPVTRSDTGDPMTTGKMICDPSVSGKVVRHAESFKGGIAKLSFVVPKTAKGKLLKVKVTIKAGTKSATKVATFRVR